MRRGSGQGGADVGDEGGFAGGGLGVEFVAVEVKGEIFGGILCQRPRQRLHQRRSHAYRRLVLRIAINLVVADATPLDTHLAIYLDKLKRRATIGTGK